MHRAVLSVGLPDVGCLARKLCRPSGATVRSRTRYPGLTPRAKLFRASGARSGTTPSMPGGSIAPNRRSPEGAAEHSPGREPRVWIGSTQTSPEGATEVSPGREPRVEVASKTAKSRGRQNRQWIEAGRPAGRIRAPEGRQSIARGVSPGLRLHQRQSSPGGATDLRPDRRPGRRT